MKKLCLLIMLLSTTSYAQEAVFKPVQELFSAMSAVDHQKMRNAATKDFQLLEAGEDWNMDDLIEVVKPSKYIRRNYFNLIRFEVMADMAWVSYWNKATYHSTEQQRVVAWLESAVMVKKEGGWKIKMLHSTRIKAEDIPENIVLTEYK